MAKAKAQEQQQTQLWQTAAPVEFNPRLKENTQIQALLISARQGTGYEVAGGQMSHAIQSRATQVLLDFTAAGCAMRYMVDGQWETIAPTGSRNG